MQTTTILADLIPIVLKTGILFLLIMAPFKWEKELGGFINKALKGAGVATIGTAAAFFGGIPYVRNKHMEAATAKQKKIEFDKIKEKGGKDWQERLDAIKPGIADRKIRKNIEQGYQTQKNAGMDIDVESETRKEWARLNQEGNKGELEEKRNEMLASEGFDREVEEEIRSEAARRMDQGRVDRLQKSENPEDKTALEEYEQKAFSEAQSDIAEEIFIKQAMEDAKKRSGYAIPINLGFLDKIAPILTALNIIKKKDGAPLSVQIGPSKATLGYFKMNEFLQRWNPAGIMSAYKERAELSKANSEKAHYRKSKITELVLGPEAALKHQQAIQRDDLGHIYRLDSMRGSAYWTAYEKAVQKFAEKNEVSMEIAGSRFRKELRRMQEEQAAKGEYLHYFEGLDLNSGEMAAIMEGYDRASTLIAQEARSVKSREAIMAEAEKAEVEWHRLDGNGGTRPTSPPSPSGGYQSQVHQQVSQNPNYDAQNIVNNDTTFNFQGMSTDEFSQTVSRRELAMRGIRSKLQDMPPGQAQEIAQAIRDANGGSLPYNVIQQINANEELKKNVIEYQGSRAIEIRTLQEHPSPANLLAKIIVRKTEGNEEAVSRISSAASRPTIESRALTDEEKRVIADAIGQNPSQIDDRMLGHVQQALQQISTSY